MFIHRYLSPNTHQQILLKWAQKKSLKTTISSSFLNTDATLGYAVNGQRQGKEKDKFGRQASVVGRQNTRIIVG